MMTSEESTSTSTPLLHLNEQPIPTSKFFTPFAPETVAVLCAGTNTGKTFLLLKLLKKRHLNFRQPFTKLVIVNCYELADGEIYRESLAGDEGLEVETISLSEFEPENLEQGCAVIFEDVNKLCEKILSTLNVQTHHKGLSFCIIVIQSLLGRGELYCLISLCHKLIITFKSIGNARLVKHIRSFFCYDEEIKDYLNKIICQGEKTKSTCLLELSEVTGEKESNFCSILNFENLFENDDASMQNSGNLAIVYPQFAKRKLFQDEFDENYVELEEGEGGGGDAENLPQEGYCLVPLRNIIRKSKKLKNSTDKPDAQEEWENTTRVIEDSIRMSMPTKKLQPALHLASAILNSKKFCISLDGRTVGLKNSPSSECSLLGFIMNANKQAGPAETVNPRYWRLAHALIASNFPEESIKNKLLRNPNPPPKEKKIKKKNPKKKPRLN